MKKLDRRDPVITPLECKLLYFLWSHRLATVNALLTLFYQDRTERAGYDRLHRLRQGGFIESIKLSGTNNRVWTLSKRGFEYLQDRVLPEVKAKSYRPQSAYHDLLVSATLQGDWMTSVPKNVRIVTEQELRLLEVEEIPNHVMKNLKHFPDGFWIFKCGQDSKAIALEVELNEKSADRYTDITTSYYGQLFCAHVIWVVGSESLAKKIYNIANDLGSARPSLHLFVEARGLESGLWKAKLLNRNLRQKSLGEFLCEMAQQKSSNVTKYPPELISKSYQNAVETNVQSPLLRFRNSFGKSNASEKR